MTRSPGLELLVLCQLIVAPLALGAVHPPVIISLAAMSHLALAGVLWGLRREPGTKLTLGIPGVALLVASAGCLLQLIPLPASLLAALAPQNHDVFSVMLGGWDGFDAPAWRPLSMAWPATGLELVKYTGYTSLYVALLSLLDSRRFRLKLVLALAVAAMVVVMLSLIHALSDAQAFFGFYEPIQQPGPIGLRGSFVNTNHQAAFLGLVALVSFGGAWHQSSKGSIRALLLLASALATTGLVVTLSRGAMAALIVCGGFLTLWSVAFHQKGRGRASFWAPAVAGGRRSGLLGATMILFLALALGFGIWVAAEPLFRKWQPVVQFERDQMKSRIWSPAGEMLTHHWLAGTGRGAGRYAYPLYPNPNVPGEPGRYTHLENLPLQMTVEWGIPLGITVLGLLGIGLLKGLGTGKPSTLRAGAGAGVLFLGLQNLVDFNLEFAGTAIPALAALALVTHHRPKKRAQSRHRETDPVLGERKGEGISGRTQDPNRSFLHELKPSMEKRTRTNGDLRLDLARSWGLVVGLLLASAAGGVAWQVGRTPTLDEIRQAEPQSVSIADIRQLGRVRIRRWPADRQTAKAMGMAFLDAGPLYLKEALWWINRVLYLDPGSPDGHVMAAQALALTGHHGQSRLEYRLAIDAAPRRAMAIIEEAARHDDRYHSLLEVAPETPAGLLGLGRFLMRQGRHAEAMDAFIRLSAVENCPANGLRLAAGAALGAGEMMETVKLASKSLHLDNQPLEGHRLLARGHQAAGNLQASAAALTHGLQHHPDHIEFHLYRLALLDRLKDVDRLGAALNQFKPFTGNSPRLQGTWLLHEGRRLMHAGQPAKALPILKNAMGTVSDGRLVCQSLARVLTDLGDPEGATAAAQACRDRFSQKP